ncbi:MAG: hypothetical protein LBD68_08915 [Zoogloeaceae bacterium]|jgi:hypothetical protein|nr:hypothetical protein [Zoogloeaceae bacterium]
MQFDLFTHSRPVMLRNDLIHALRERAPTGGREAYAKLAAECPEDSLLAPTLLLIDQLETRSAPFSSHLEAQRAIRRAESALSDAATAIFGAAGADRWMTPVWLALAEACGKLAYCRDIPAAHAANMLIRARDWEGAEAATARIPSWRRIPDPLAWMAEARFRLRGEGAAWPLLAELAWRAPPRFAVLARRLDAPSLARLIREFECDFAGDADDFAWFPAWALIAEAGLGDGLCAERTPEYTPPEQAVWMLRKLFALERQGNHRELVENRKTLRALHPDLFTRYMRARE